MANSSWSTLYFSQTVSSCAKLIRLYATGQNDALNNVLGGTLRVITQPKYDVAMMHILQP